jgi:hypothetical protein
MHSHSPRNVEPEPGSNDNISLRSVSRKYLPHDTARRPFILTGKCESHMFRIRKNEFLLPHINSHGGQRAKTAEKDRLPDRDAYRPCHESGSLF